MQIALDEFRRIIETALAGRSAIGAATAAGLPRDAISRVLRGREPRLTRVAEICDALGLELYIGPPRDSADNGPPRASPDAPDGKGAGGPAIPDRAAHSIQRSAHNLVRLAMDAGRNPIPGDLWPIIAAQWGEAPGPDGGNLPADAQPVDVIELEAAAGGSGDLFDNGFKGRVWFRQRWLEERGLDAGQCVVIGVKGDSMVPTLPDGCSILVDRSSVEWEPPRVLVVRTANGLAVKRAACGEGGARIMQSDNPYWPDAPLPADAEIVGRVRWMASGLE